MLKNGLPDWKSALYYYRHVRKMGLAEMGIILFVILTIGQYLIAWAAYVEKRYTAESILGSKLKKLQKKNKTNVDMDTLLNQIPSPSIKNTLPFQISRAIWNIPSAIKEMFAVAAEYRQQQKEQMEQEAAEQERLAKIEEDFLKEKELKKEGIRRRKEKYAAREKTEEELRGYSKLNMDKMAKGSVMAVNQKHSATSSSSSSGGFWSDDDLIELIRLVKKYPSGSAARWDTISQAMNRSVTEVTFMAAKMKENGYRVPGHTDSVAENIIIDATKNKIKTKRPPEAQLVLPETTWSQEQQKLLELAIVKYPKTIVTDRWQKIANSVPGKTKEECLIRYRYLVELVKTQKSKANRVEDVVETVDAPNDDDEGVCNNDDNIIVEVNEDGPTNVGQIKAEVIQTKGKPKNKRKERKKQMDFSSSEEESDSELN